MRIHGLFAERLFHGESRPKGPKSKRLNSATGRPLSKSSQRIEQILHPRLGGPRACPNGSGRRPQRAYVAGSGSPPPSRPCSSVRGERGWFRQAASTARERRRSRHRRGAIGVFWSSYIQHRRCAASSVADLTKQRPGRCDVVHRYRGRFSTPTGAATPR